MKLQGFRVELERALRVDETHDWSIHCVDYTILKERLSYFAQRRRTIRKLLRDSPDERIAEPVLVGIMGPKTHRPPSPTDQPLEYGGAGYIPFVDDMEVASTDDSLDSRRSWGYGRERHVKRLKRRAIAKRINNAERNEIIIFLSWEMEKVVTFYFAQWQNLSQRIQDEGCSEELEKEILELFAFCAVNIVVVRQSLIRYDAFLRTFGDPPMMQWYLKKMTKEKHHTSYRKMLIHEELNALIDIYVSEMQSDTSDFLRQVNMFEEILESTHRAEMLASTGHVALRDTFVQTLRDYFLLGFAEDRLGLQPNLLTLRGTSLTKEIHMIIEWRAGRAVMEEPEPSKKLTFQEYFRIALNLLSTFFYCMNYYIVEPSSTKYVNALGAPDEVSGLLIGMMPIAAMISSIVYSIWTNQSFRVPFLASSFLLLAGNLVYATAFNHGIVGVALAGRFMTGLGCPKVIVRRFMADTTPVTLRTSVNAGFGMAVAVGSAMGPATAILLDKFEFAQRIPFLGTIYLNGMTGPGYFMAMLWTIFSLVVIVSFREPDRNGLEEQKQLEAVAANATKQELSLPEDTASVAQSTTSAENGRDDDLNTVFSGETRAPIQESTPWSAHIDTFLVLITIPVRLCLFFLFCKTFTIEALSSATSALTKNRYGWKVAQVGTLGCINGLSVIPVSVVVGWLSLYHQDRLLMTALLSIGCFGMFLLVDLTDLIDASAPGYNEDNLFAVHPPRYIAGYFLAFCSIQAFEGVIGSTLSKVIPTALASGTFNSGLLATLVDTLGRASGDVFIFFVGGINMRQLMNLLFIPAFFVLTSCLVLIRANYDVLAV